VEKKLMLSRNDWHTNRKDRRCERREKKKKKLGTTSRLCTGEEEKLGLGKEKIW
jgi:hypothetical protein